MLSSPRRPSNTMRIFSSAEYCLRVARRMSWTTFSAGSLDDRVCCLIFAPVNVTMSQKLSLLQSANSVSRALTADRNTYTSVLDVQFNGPAITSIFGFSDKVGEDTLSSLGLTSFQLSSTNSPVDDI